MKTAIIQIGNSDDKLTQFEWSEFCNDLHKLILCAGFQIHFAGYSPPAVRWQNFCIVFDVDLDSQRYKETRETLVELRDKYKQDSIALTIGETFFV